MTDYVLPGDIIPGNLAPLFRANTEPFRGPDGKELCLPYTQAAAENYARLKRCGFFDEVDPAGFLNDPIRLRRYGSTLTTRQIVEFAAPEELYLWQPVEVMVVTKGKVSLKVRSNYRLDTCGAMVQTAGGMPAVIASRPETPLETVIRETREEIGLKLSADQLHHLGLNSSIDSPSIYALRTQNHGDIPGIVPEHLVSYAARSQRPSHRFRQAIRLSGEGVAMVSLTADNLADLIAHRSTKIEIMPSSVPFTTFFTRGARSMAEVQRRFRGAQKLKRDKINSRGHLQAARLITATRAEFSDRALVVAAEALHQSKTPLKPHVLAFVKNFRRRNIGIDLKKLGLVACNPAA